MPWRSKGEGGGCRGVGVGGVQRRLLRGVGAETQRLVQASGMRATRRRRREQKVAATPLKPRRLRPPLPP